ncbi:glycosyl transferase family 1 [Halopolyspora algeriensis]|uniref:Glycosyl transferase family 1 n=1 Tax=Halopolyspora algeriensis TaxID=1500506 RepID=A0A368VRR0_9ACTN|nr:glycosyltransferase [Halopolyspora algeriensis]RCW44622.1 glycosyl transferase family 1 [Halopolyspora algeriensis]TQM55983.1 glycosyl transferase family 1 [Halopolyspora algeriensis]
MRILVWHVHGAWSTAFVHGDHTYLVPVTPNRDADGRGRARTYPWPDNAVEVTADELRSTDVDVVVLQRPHEMELTEKWLGRRPGIDVPAVFVEHDTPRGEVASTRHPLAERSDIPIVHVTHFNAVFWDCGRAPTTVIEHGIVDPGHHYTGELERAGVVINEPVRRARIAGTDLLPSFAPVTPLDVYGMRVGELPEWLGIARDRLTVHEDLPQQRMHAELARRRVYLHPFRWTSLGLSLVEAMHLGMPVVALAATEAIEAVPAEAGVVSTRPDVLTHAVREFLGDAHRAEQAGRAARAAAREKYSLERFLAAWDGLLQEVTG